MALPWDSEVPHKEESEMQALDGVGVPTVALQPQSFMQGLTREEYDSFRTAKMQKIVYFSGFGTVTPNLAQVNYLAANSMHDRMPGLDRPEIDAVTLLQGAVGGTVGMRWKSFGSADMMANAEPEAMIQMHEECQILRFLSTRMFPPELIGGLFVGNASRGMFLMQSAGTNQNPPFMMSENVDVGQGQGIERSEAKVPDVEPKQVMRPQTSRTDAAPLGGWPGLFTPSPADAGQAATPLKVCDGARVRLVGLNASSKINGRSGTVVKQFKDGKWKVAIDEGLGNALVTADRLQVLSGAAAAPTATEDMEAAAASAAKVEAAQLASDKRRDRVAEKRAELKEKVGAKDKNDPQLVD